MGRELQKRKNRSSRPRVQTHKSKKVLNPRGNDIVAKNWFVVHFYLQLIPHTQRMIVLAAPPASHHPDVLLLPTILPPP